MTSPYAAIGAKLVERGYAAIPVIPNSKRPGSMVRGEWVGLPAWNKEYSSRLPSGQEIEEWSESGAGVGVVCGPASKGLVAVDIDTDDDAIKAAILRAIPGSMLRKRGAKGECLFYCAPDIEASKSWNLPGSDGKQRRVCDLIGPGRQTLLPPTIHPDTREPYVWLAGVALEDTDCDDIPILPATAIEAIGDALKPFGWKAEPQPAHLNQSDPDSPFRKLNEDALRNLHKWVPALQLARCRPARGGYEAVPHWRPSNTGQPTEKRKRNLKVHHTGIIDAGDGPKGYTAIDLVMHTNGCDFDTAFKFLSDRLWESHREIRIVSLTPDDPQWPIVHIKHDNDDEFLVPPAELALEQLTYCNGLVGSCIDWICETSRIPNRVLALSAAVTTIGTIVGRRVQGPTWSPTNLYVIGLAETGSGKDHPLNSVSKLLGSARADHHVSTSGQWTSLQAMTNDLVDKALMVAVKDEFGSFLARINSHKASGWESAINMELRKLWSIGFNTYNTVSSAQVRGRSVHAPSFSILGMSTPATFYSALQAGDIENGFLNRMLVVQSERYVDHVTPLGHEVPNFLAEALSELYLWDGTDNHVRLIDRDYKPCPDVVGWESDVAKNNYDEFVDYTRRRMRRNPEIANFLSRTAEIGVRLATIMSVGRWGRGGPGVDLSDILWGIDVSSNCTERTIAAVHKYMNKELSYGAVYNTVLDMISKKDRISRKSLFHELGGSVRSIRELDQTIALLYEGGRINILRFEHPSEPNNTAIWYEKIAS